MRFKIKDRVIAHSKSAGKRFNQSDYSSPMYVTGFDGNNIICNEDFYKDQGNFFLEKDLEFYELPENWCVQGTENPIIIDLIEKKYNQNFVFYKDYYYYNNNFGKIDYSESKPKGHILFTENELIHYLNKDKIMSIISFKLIKKYPGCKHELGYIEPYTTGEYVDYPEFWEPQYKQIYNKVSIGNKDKVANVYKDYIIYDDIKIEFSTIEEIIKPFINYSKIIGGSNYELSFPDYTISIGCTSFTKNDIDKIFKSRESL